MQRRKSTPPSVNDARLHARDEIEGQWSEKGVIVWDELEDHLNGIPYSAIDHNLPKDELVRVLASPLH